MHQNSHESGAVTASGTNSDDCLGKEIAGKTIQVLHRFTNNLTVDVEEDIDHHHDVLATISPANNNNLSDSNRNSMDTNAYSSIDTSNSSSMMDTNENTISSTNRGSDESTVTSSSSGTNRVASPGDEYEREPDGTIKPYINLKDLNHILQQNPDLDSFFD